MGDRLALDFANARFFDGPASGDPGNYEALVEFFVKSRLIWGEAKPALLGHWASAPDDAMRLLHRALLFRDALRMILVARIDGAEVLPGWVEPINEILAYTEGYDRLEPIAEHEEGQLGMAGRTARAGAGSGMAAHGDCAVGRGDHRGGSGGADPQVRESKLRAFFL